MKFLICGLGSIGQRHARNLLALGYTDVAVYRTGRGNSACATAFLDRHDLRVYTDLDAALATRPDVAIVTNPTALHVPVGLRAACAGCHLLIEKPLSDSLEAINRLTEAVDRRGLQAYVAYNLRFHPALGTLKVAIAEGRIGRPVSVHAEMGEFLPDWHPWEDYRRMYASVRALGGGVILTQSHELDYLCWLFGPVSRVAAFGGHLTDLVVDVEDVAKILMDFVAGPVASLHVDFLKKPMKRQCEVLGTNGRVTWDGVTGRVVYLASRTDAVEELLHDSGEWELNQSFVDQLQYFIECVESGRRPFNNLAEARRILEVILAARESLETGRVVSLPHSGTAGIMGGDPYGDRPDC